MTQKEFAQMDYDVMRCAYDSQNELGRLCDEVIYRNDLAARLQATGLAPVHKEVPVTVSHRDFAKTYRMDLVVGDAAVYELKAEIRLAADHEAQLLNYLFLCGASHGKLVNFRPAQVESRFVNGTLTLERRRQLGVDLQRWRETDDGSHVLRTTVLEILEDWGNFLELSLYTEVLIHALGGEGKVVKPLELKRDGVVLGNQRFLMAGPETAFRLTALVEGADGYTAQLEALLRHSPLRCMQWINLGRNRIEFVTLRR